MPTRVFAGYWDLDLETREVLLCPRSQRMFGLASGSPKRLAGYDWQPRIHPDDMPVIEGELEAAQRCQEIYAARFRTIRPDGSICQVLGVGRTTADNPKRFVGLNFDLDDAAATAERVSQSMRHYVMHFAVEQPFDAPPANENESRPWRSCSPGSSRPVGRPGLESTRKILLQRAQATIDRRDLRKIFLNPAMFGEPAFDLLLSLYISPTHPIVSASELGTVVGLSPSSTMRWLKFLVKEGLVLTAEEEIRDPDTMAVALTDRARTALDDYFKAAGEIP
ncbi:MAG TPA: PAS domain-containing protein [Sphingomicrobium sp.]|nr:PAS domain-containing protein [Sphingomicrobium sp.]